ncbi:protein transport protein gos1 [Malassezia japonica]|uniref:Golgi SNAP receptor complex member 1 n=1 Tax=Malassezia japonica TaxID=223818 RepID=A0AAF0J8Y3_9BASI|nr:protein transport protein gos1 [Malassezia japonica]WFD37575.1 protein transport protein gos1 [Malassezia japonica]
MSWEAQSRRVRQVQQRLDAKLTAYSQLVSDAASNSSPLSTAPSVAVDMNSGATSATPDPASLEAEIQALLVQYADAQAELSTLLNDPALPPTQTQLHTVQRHRELLMELERDFFRTKTNLLHALSRKQLLGHVKEDISAYRAQHQSETQAYLDERAHLDRSQRMMDETLDQAYATQSEFRAQRNQLSNTLQRMTNAAAQVPGLNSILTMITRRRRRDTIILAVLIGVCVVILLMVGTRR